MYVCMYVCMYAFPLCFSSGHSAAAVPAGDDGRGISVFYLFQPGSGGNQRDHPELSLGLLESESRFSVSQHGTLWQARGGGNAGPELYPGESSKTINPRLLNPPKLPYIKPLGGEGFWDGDNGGYFCLLL